MRTIRVFVYGTLKPGGVYHQQFCAPYLEESQLAQAQGRLYDLPILGYPVMTLGEGWVKGYLFTLHASALAGLDWLEGYAPEQRNLPYETCNDDFEEEYLRQRIIVFDLAGKSLGEAWVYIMHEPPDGAVWLANGEWPLSHD